MKNLAEIINEAKTPAKSVKSRKIVYKTKPNKYGVAVFAEQVLNQWSTYESKYGLKNKNTKEIYAKAKFYEIKNYRSYFLAITTDARSKDALFSPRGKMLSKHARLDPIMDNKFIRIRDRSHQKGVIDRTGKEILPLEYDKIDWDNKTRILSAEKKGAIELYDSKMKLLNPADVKWEKQNKLFKNFYEIIKNGKSGVWNKETDKIIIPMIYDELYLATTLYSDILKGFYLEDGSLSGFADLSGNAANIRQHRSGKI